MAALPSECLGVAAQGAHHRIDQNGQESEPQGGAHGEIGNVQIGDIQTGDHDAEDTDTPR